MISLVVKLPIKEGKVDEFIELFKELMAHVSQEEGNLLYSINKNPAEPNTVVIMERYKDEEALATHSSSDYFKEYNAKFAPYVAGRPEITKMEEVHAV